MIHLYMVDSAANIVYYVDAVRRRAAVARRNRVGNSPANLDALPSRLAGFRFSTPEPDENPPFTEPPEDTDE